MANDIEKKKSDKPAQVAKPAKTAKPVAKKPSVMEKAKATAAASTSPDGKKKFSLKKYWKDLKSEFRKVVWPTKKQVINNTGVVLVTMAVVGVFIWALDIGLSQLLHTVLGVGLGQ